MQTRPPDCRCDGSGTYTVSIPIADAIVSDLRECPVHSRPRILGDHDEYECPGCPGLVEYRIVADVYGCDAGRHCTQATPQQRVAFEEMIAERVAALGIEKPEAT